MSKPKNLVDGPEIPMGLGMALAQNQDAMERFAHLPQAEQQKLIEHTHEIRSKKEMKQFADQIAHGSIG